MKLAGILNAGGVWAGGEGLEGGAYFWKLFSFVQARVGGRW